MGKSLHLKFCKKIFDFLVALGKATLCVITIGELLHATTYHDRRTLNDFLKIGLKALVSLCLLYGIMAYYSKETAK